MMKSLLKRLMPLSKMNSWHMDVLSTYCTRAVCAGLGIVTSILIARFLTPSARGVYAVAMVWAALGTQFGNFGLHAANLIFVSPDRKNLSQLLSHSLFVTFAFSGFFGMILFIRFLFESNADSWGAFLYVLIFLFVPPNLFYVLAQSLLIGLQQIRFLNCIDLANRFATLILVLICIFLSAFSLHTAFLCSVLGASLSALAIWRYLVRQTNEPLRNDWALFGQSIRIGLKVYVTDLTAFSVLKVVLLLVYYIMNAEQAGYFSISMLLGDMIYMFAVTVGALLVPKLYAKQERQWQIVQKVTLITGLSMFLIITTAYFFTRPIVQFLFGERYLPSITPFLLMLPGIFFLSLQTVSVKYLLVNGYPLAILYAWLVALASCIILGIIWIPQYGLNGAALALTLSNILVTLLNYCTALRQSRSIPVPIRNGFSL